MKWLRWKIAERVDAHYIKSCWTHLACWALFPEQHRFWEILSLRDSQSLCWKDLLPWPREEPEWATCYCAKLHFFTDEGAAHER